MKVVVGGGGAGRTAAVAFPDSEKLKSRRPGHRSGDNFCRRCPRGFWSCLLMLKTSKAVPHLELEEEGVFSLIVEGDAAAAGETFLLY